MNYLPDEQRKTAQKKKQKLRENKGTKNEMAEAEKKDVNVCTRTNEGATWKRGRTENTNEGTGQLFVRLHN